MNNCARCGRRLVEAYDRPDHITLVCPDAGCQRAKSGWWPTMPGTKVTVKNDGSIDFDGPGDYHASAAYLGAEVIERANAVAEAEALAGENNRRIEALGAKGVTVDGLQSHWLEEALAELLGPERTALVTYNHNRWVAAQLDKVEGQVREALEKIAEQEAEARRQAADEEAKRRLITPLHARPGRMNGRPR